MNKNYNCKFCKSDLTLSQFSYWYSCHKCSYDCLFRFDNNDKLDIAIINYSYFGHNSDCKIKYNIHFDFSLNQTTIYKIQESELDEVILFKDNQILNITPYNFEEKTKILLVFQ